MIKRTLLMTNGHFRPYRSAAIPKVIAPTDRSMSTRVMPHVISFLLTSNVSARFSTVKETVKKSKASHDQAKKETRKNNHCCLLSGLRRLKGFATLSKVGMRVEKRVAA
jgi:hypothetical protein